MSFVFLRNYLVNSSAVADNGPHLFNLPDGFLIAVSRSFRRYVDIFNNKTDLNEADVQHVISLAKVLNVLARNVDNLSQLASNSSVNDCVAIAGLVLRKEFLVEVGTFLVGYAIFAFCTILFCFRQHGNLQRWTDQFVRLTFRLLRSLHDPSSLWIRTLRRLVLSANHGLSYKKFTCSVFTRRTEFDDDFVASSPPPVQSCVMNLITSEPHSI